MNPSNPSDTDTSQQKSCLGCGASLPAPFLDLGCTPLANSYVPVERANDPEPSFPLAVAYCPKCHLVQLTHIVDPEDLFSEYSYFSSYSDSYVKHAERYAASVIERFDLGESNTVVEVASNDGYLLQYFRKASVPVLGIEPAKNIAAVAVERGIPTLSRFFGKDAVSEILSTCGPADILIGNNVLAHVPQINDFLSAVHDTLKPNGHAIFEFPSLVDLMNHSEFDTVYHEHVFYYSLTAINVLAARANLKLVDVEHQTVHGGSLRVFLAKDKSEAVSARVEDGLRNEADAGLTTSRRYATFSQFVSNVREQFVTLLEGLRSAGHSVAAYGAPAKGNTLLNFCRVKAGVIDFTVDRSPYKQGRLLPGSRIPILAPEELLRQRPDYAVILPWNLAEEIITQQDEYLNAGGKFILPIPSPMIVSAPETAGSLDNKRLLAAQNGR